jgi:hypothetical protein
MASQGKCRWNGNQDAKPARSCDDGRSMERVHQATNARRATGVQAALKKLRRRSKSGVPAAPCYWAPCNPLRRQSSRPMLGELLHNHGSKRRGVCPALSLLPRGLQRIAAREQTAAPANTPE